MMESARYGGSHVEYRFKRDMGPVDHHPAGFGEHDSHPGAQSGLDLAEPPFGALRMTDDHPGFEKFVHAAPRDGLDALSGTELAGLVGARICHDLISPLGAIGNGVELLELTGQSAGPELSLIGQSVISASARLQFFRVALGSPAPGQTLPAAELSGLLALLSRTGRIGMDWRIEGAVPAQWAQLAFLGIMCLESAMPIGGKIVIGTCEDGWRLRASAPRFLDLDHRWVLLDAPGAVSGLSGAHLQFALAPLRARALGVSFGCIRGVDVIEIQIGSRAPRSDGPEHGD